MASSNSLVRAVPHPVATDRLMLEYASPAEALLSAPVKRGARHIVWLVGSLVLAGTAALALVPIDMVVTSPGHVISLAPTIAVQPLETSIVRTIEVREGQVVKAGDLLARLDPTFSAADAGALSKQVDSYQAEIERLEAEALDRPFQPKVTNTSTAVQKSLYASRQSQYRSQVESFDQKIKGLQSTLSQAQSDIRAYSQRLAIAQSLERIWRELEARKVGTYVNLMGAQDRRIELERNLASSTALAEKSDRDLRQTVADREAFLHQWKAQIGEELSTRQRSLGDARENLQKANLRHRLVELHADRDAVVLTVAPVAVGSVVQSGDQLISLLPANAPLEVEARVDGNDAGLVGTGHDAVIKFDSLPFVRFGHAEGKVRTVSADSFTTLADDMQHGAGVSRARQVAPYYKARITVDSIQMHDVPGGFQLKAGMPVTADIKLGRRTVLSYVFAQVMATGLEGMREP